MAKVNASGKAVGEATAVKSGIQQVRVVYKQAAKIPALPNDCNLRQNPNVQPSDDISIIAQKNNAALRAANDRVQRCYRLSERNRQVRK